MPQTTNARICVWGTPPNLMLPNRLAEEYAMLDVMSGGRLEVAFPLGTGMAAHAPSSRRRPNAIVPGWTMTERQVRPWLTPEREQELLRRQCLKRKLLPEDVARV